MTTQPVPATDDLEQRFPRWQVWQADSGAWWASVRRNLTPNQERAGCQPFLCAESSEELAGLLLEDDARSQVSSRGEVAR